MRKERIILAAVCEKGVTCGVSKGRGTYLPQQFLELVAAANADSWDLTRGGAIAYFLESRRVPRLLESFFARAEALKGSMPLLGIGMAQEVLVGTPESPSK